MMKPGYRDPMLLCRKEEAVLLCAYKTFGLA